MCRTLLLQAFNRFNIRGIALRQPSPMGFACIIMLRWILIITEDMKHAQVRLLSALCVEHLRIYMERGSDPPPLSVCSPGTLFSYLALLLSPYEPAVFAKCEQPHAALVPQT